MKKLLFLFLTMFAFTAYAGSYNPPEPCCEGDVTQNQIVYVNVDAPAGADGQDGIDGESYYGVDSYDKESIDSMAAHFSAMANIPGLNHRSGGHAHTGVGVGVGMAGDELAGAFGITHHLEDNVVLKASTAFSKEYRNTYGVGASISW